MIASPPVVSFAPLPAGWHTFVGASFATSWPYRVSSRDGWAAHMPQGGIVVSVTFPNSRVRYKRLRLVLPARPSVMLEGTTDTPEYRIEGRTHGRDVIIFVDIRNRHPTVAERRVAQRVVQSIRFS